MKNTFFYIVIIILSITHSSNVLFAQSTNERYKAINDYFGTIEKDTSQVVFVAKEKINSNVTLSIFGLNHIVAVNLAGKGIGDSNIYNKKDFDKMKKQYKDKCIPGKRIWCNDDYWTKDNFVNKKIVFESMNTDKEIEIILDKYDNFNSKVYGFSEPIFYKNKKYIVFTVTKSYISGAYQFVVIMQKLNGKWIMTYEASDPNLIN